MGEFLYICEYPDVTPMAFFNEDRKYSLSKKERWIISTPYPMMIFN